VRLGHLAVVGTALLGRVAWSGYCGDPPQKKIFILGWREVV
jgi:hypothetical protein